MKILLGFVLGIACMLFVGYWKVPDRKAALESDVLYSWITTDDRRVDLAIQDGGMMLYVGSTDQKSAYFQMSVRGDEISTFHSLRYAQMAPGLFEGINLDSKAGEVSKFIVTSGRQEPQSIFEDTDGDLIFDRRRMVGAGGYEKIKLQYEALIEDDQTKTAQPSATDNPDDAQRLREDH